VTTSPTFAFGPPMPFPRRNRLEANPLTGRRQIDTLPDGRIIGVFSETAASSIVLRTFVSGGRWAVDG
jgi:hypothetical protein